jgi:DNA modification methylase
VIYHIDDIPEHLKEFFEPAPQLGLESTPAEYVEKMAAVFREVRRVLKDDGTLWLNLGDSYASGTNADRNATTTEGDHVPASWSNRNQSVRRHPVGLKAKDLVGIPWRVAFALQADGWWLRSDIIWCLSGGTWVYARTQKGDMPIMLRDAARLDPATVKLWNGEKWTQVLGWSRSKRLADELEIVLRSGERISCTPTHQFPTTRGLLAASELKVGDCLQSVQLAEPELPKDSLHIGLNAAWFAGLYLAEGSRSDDCIQIAGHAKEEARWARVKAIAESYGGTATRTIDGNNMNIRVYSRMLCAIIDELVSGRTAIDKCLATTCWRYSNAFLREYLAGYLSGDGAWDEANQRWRLGFCRNYNLERDLRTLAARLGFSLTLSPSCVPYKGKRRASFRGEIRFMTSDHHNCKDREEIVEIRKARCRYVYDVGVEDEPHLFALASGILTHNSKPNPMPESVTDRPTKAHEYIFLLSKSERYFYDHEAVKEESVSDHPSGNGFKRPQQISRDGRGSDEQWQVTERRNKRTVWNVGTEPYPEAHFATFPEKLIEPCILAGAPAGGIVLEPFAGSGTTLSVAKRLGRKAIGIELNPAYVELAKRRISVTTASLF